MTLQLLKKTFDPVFIEPNQLCNVTFAGPITEVVTALPERKKKVKILSAKEVEEFSLDPSKQQNGHKAV